MKRCHYTGLAVVLMASFLSCTHPKPAANRSPSRFTKALQLNGQIAYEDNYRHTVAQLGNPDNPPGRAATGRALTIKGTVFSYTDHYTILLQSVDFEHHPSNYIRADQALLNSNATADAIQIFQPEQHDEDLLGDEAKNYRVYWIPATNPPVYTYWLLYFSQTNGRLCKMQQRTYD